MISEQVMVEFEEQLRELVAELPGVRCAFIFGSWASRTLHEGSDLDLYLAVDDDLAVWDALQPVFDFEQDLYSYGIREIQAFTQDPAAIERNLRPSGLYVDIYGKPTVPLLGSFDELIGAAGEPLRVQTLGFLERLEREGHLDGPRARRLAELRSR